MKKLIAGNWKMHGNFDMTESFDAAMENVSDGVVDWLICPPIPYMANIANTLRGAQDCSETEQGAFTGEVSAAMLDDIGCDFCIVGHSERRTNHGETNAQVQNKASQVINNDITVIVCVGETLEQRESDQEFTIVEQQIRESLPKGASAINTVIAYEPVWAIGTGKAATSDDVIKMHGMIRTLLESILADGGEMRILYGGSVKPSNAEELLNLDNVDGALIGGASLKPDDFIAIGNAVKK
jgi:triosephosphate isomerase